MKQTIKDVSIQLFYKKGYFATGMSEIARAAGIQKSSIYYHYSNKEDILFDILQSTLLHLEAHLEHALADAEGPEERMRAAVSSHVIFHLEQQKEVLIADSELRGLTVENYKTILQMRDRYESRFQEILQEGMAEGVFEATDCKVASYAILTMCTAVSSWFNPKGRLSGNDIARTYTHFVLRGLSAVDKQDTVRTEQKGGVVENGDQNNVVRISSKHGG